MIAYASRRVSDRRTLNTPATILFEDDTTLPCSTINVSDGGVKINLPRDVTLPPDFRISIPAERVKNKRSRMVWRMGDEIGIRFT